MSNLTIRNLDDGLKRRLRDRAAEQKRSMEEEAREILRCALSQQPVIKANLADAIREIICDLRAASCHSTVPRPVSSPKLRRAAGVQPAHG
jgi:plasmid stability protein